MRIRDLNERFETKPKGQNAKTVCEYLTICKIPYDKEFKSDFSGAEFTLRDAPTINRVFAELSQHKNISSSFILDKDLDNLKIHVRFAGDV